MLFILTTWRRNAVTIDMLKNRKFWRKNNFISYDSHAVLLEKMNIWYIAVLLAPMWLYGRRFWGQVGSPQERWRGMGIKLS